MAKSEKTNAWRRYTARHRTRGAQVWICLGKLLRMFVYQNDWKVLPMSALIAGLVGMVIRKRFCLNMEGTVMGAFALVCVCIWNGAFNSIQVICRERDVVKREHRSGLHVSSYVVSHMLYQAFLCLLQTGITLYVTLLIGVKYPSEGLIIDSALLEMGVSMFLISYSSDMLSLWISSLSRTTTTAMTVMPFVLIFQLVFSGGMMQLPEWTNTLTYFTVSNPGLKVIAAQADTNNRPFVTISGMIDKMWDDPVNVRLSLGQVLDALSRDEDPVVADIRSRKIELSQAAGAALRLLYGGADTVAPDSPGKAALSEALAALEAADAARAPAEKVLTVGEFVDRLREDPWVQEHREDTYTASPTVGQVLGLIGKDKVRTELEDRSAKASFREAYEYTRENVVTRWLHLAFFALAFSFLSMVTLKFIDKDKR